MDFKDIYILTDMDGTLINSSHEISMENKAAIADFVAGGGTFGVATGRAPHGLPMFTTGLCINGYSIITNGAVIFDTNKNEVLHCGTLNRKLLTPFIGKMIDEISPPFSVQYYTNKGVHIASNTGYIDQYVVKNNLPHTLKDYREMDYIDWNKIIFHSPEIEKLLEIEKLARGEFEGVFDMNFSGDMYFEIIPLGYTKGDSLNRLREMPQYRGKKFVALGDHQNDVKMLKFADFAVCPKTALEEAKAACNLVADVSNDEHLLAWTINKLKSGEIDF